MVVRRHKQSLGNIAILSFQRREKYISEKIGKLYSLYDTASEIWRVGEGRRKVVKVVNSELKCIMVIDLNNSHDWCR